jgi:DNA polymerase-4
MPLQWLFLDMNSYFASCEQEDRPGLRGRPVGVVPMLADSTCVIAASYEAKAFGVKTGTGVKEARLLCPGITLVEARPKLYTQIHEAIVNTVSSELPAPHVLSIDEMACRLWANERTGGDAVRLALHVKAKMRRDVGSTLRCSIGIAPNGFLAKVATDLYKPNGLVVLRAEDVLKQHGVIESYQNSKNDEAVTDITDFDDTEEIAAYYAADPEARTDRTSKI